jgi:hypothetical protein
LSAYTRCTFASPHRLPPNAKSQAAPAEGGGETPDSRAARYRKKTAAAAAAAEKRLTLQGSGRKKSSADQARASRTYSGYPDGCGMPRTATAVSRSPLSPT